MGGPVIPPAVTVTAELVAMADDELVVTMTLGLVPVAVEVVDWAEGEVL